MKTFIILFVTHLFDVRNWRSFKEPFSERFYDMNTYKKTSILIQPKSLTTHSKMADERGAPANRYV